MKSINFSSFSLSLLGGLTMLSCAEKQEQDNRAPNIIYIMSDDHTSQAVSAYGGILADVMPTPNIDRIANEGVKMNNCFVTNSISTPSRAAILTGQYSQKNGVYTLADRIDPDQNIENLRDIPSAVPRSAGMIRQIL